ncbi:ATP-binding protein [Pseudoalteromonas sp. SMS1]|uniref:ATP-binding protein n=1 Tax=Pseudoalteromonas sp. SMS1 TaxID=2908894 RepID=UPI001F195802|nr:ATP-binding protein [Pseudoalteromonas sp. SMS1]MCF2857670.1 ATP-binding protein [Pseudoalteromonas sp. SMS1]
MENSVNQMVVVVGPESAELDYVLTQLQVQVYQVDAFKQFKKTFRKHRPGVLILHVNDADSEALTCQVLSHVRVGLQDKDTIFIVAHSQQYMPDALNWIEEYSIASFITLSADKKAINQSVIDRNIKAWLRFVQVTEQHQAESNLLMSVAHLHRNNNNVNEVMLQFMQALSSIACASVQCRIKINAQGEGTLTSCAPALDTLERALTQAFHLPTLPAYLQRALTEKKPQIDLLPDAEAFSNLSQLLNLKLSSYLIFPIVVYGKVLEMMIFFIDENAMESVSMRQIDVISKAAEQLTMLLERKESERRLKKQCTRLKSALIELKETQEQLAHSEKMATVGQFAAGIAHEINNPLSFVLSNFGSMDNYLDSILNLQNLHDQFLSAVEMGNQHRKDEIKDEITHYRGQSEIDFIYDDMREIVAQSQMGLARVSDIIKDLQSFHGKAQHAQLDLKTLLANSLALLQSTNPSDIPIETNFTHHSEIVSNAGFIQQILTNLIKNAFQILELNAISEPIIEVSSTELNGVISISVTDNGPGISIEQQKRVFDPFYTTKKVGEGTGLGLAVSYNLSKRLGGSLQVNSQVDKYCKFTLVLPINAEGSPQ